MLDPSSQVFDPATIQTITGLLIVELSAEPRIDIISATEVKKLAELEGDKQAAGCVDSSCLAELAGAMGARYVIFGDVGKLGETVVMTLNLFDSKTTQAVQRITVQASDGIGGLPGALKGKLAPLVTPLLGSDDTKVASTEQPAPAASADDDGGEGGGPLPWVLLGSGAVFLVGGPVFDAVSPTAKNGVVDLYDAVNPAAIVVGAGLAVVGAVVLLTSDDSGAEP